MSGGVRGQDESTQWREQLLPGGRGYSSSLPLLPLTFVAPFLTFTFDLQSSNVVHVSRDCGSSFAGMFPVLLAALILALSTSGTASESAALRFLGQTNFVVTESSTTVVRLVVERVGEPVNVTALVLVGNGDLSVSTSLLGDVDSVHCSQVVSEKTGSAENTV